MNDMMLMTLTSTKTRECSPGGTRVKVCYAATKVSNKKKLRITVTSMEQKKQDCYNKTL
jgi:hypothetical protein